MADEVFIDASFWIALMDKRDQQNENARSIWESFVGNAWRRVTTNWTLYESLTVLNSRRSARHDLALGLLDFVRHTGTVVEDASNFEQTALDVFRSHSDKRWSVVDCANFVCIRERRSRLALSYDIRDFGQAQTEFGFSLLGA